MMPGSEAIGEQATEFAPEADGPSASHLASATAAQPPCRFFQREIVADTVVTPWEHCWPDCHGADTIITVDTVDYVVADYTGVVYDKPKYTYEDGAQVVDMQPFRATHQKVGDLVIWTCDEGYQPELSLSLEPNLESWVYKLHLRKDPWGIAGKNEWVVALLANWEFPSETISWEFQRVGELRLLEIEGEVIIERGSAKLTMGIREEPCRPQDGDDCVDS